MSVYLKKKKKRGVEITNMHRNVSQIHVAFYPKKKLLGPPNHLDETTCLHHSPTPPPQKHFVVIIQF